MTIGSWAIFGIRLALAEPLDDCASSPHACLDAGDRAWSNAERREAREAWSAAALTDDPAVRAMAELRLVLVSGSLGLAVHGERSDRALAECFAMQDPDPWCDLAAADSILIQQEVGIPTDVNHAILYARSVLDDLPGPASARLIWAGAMDSGEEVPVSDGLGNMMRTHGGWPAGPGTWTLNLSPLAGTGMGLGAALRFYHPDLAWRGWSLGLGLMATSEGFTVAGMELMARDPFLWGAAARIHQQRIDLYVEEALVQSFEIGTLQSRPRVGFDTGAFRFLVGPLLRWDSLDGFETLDSAHGAHLSLAWHPPVSFGHLSIRNQTESSLSAYTFVTTHLDSIWQTHRWALRIRADRNWSTDAPLWRGPVYGAGTVLRSAPLGRLRADQMAASIVEWRPRISPMLGAAVFAEGAWADDFYAGAGAGLRLYLPPRPHNTLRMDGAYGMDGWVLTAGWGEAF